MKKAGIYHCAKWVGRMGVSGSS